MGFGKGGNQSSQACWCESNEGIQWSSFGEFFVFYCLFIAYFPTHAAGLRATQGSLDCWCDSNGCLLGSPHPPMESPPSSSCLGIFNYASSSLISALVRCSFKTSLALKLANMFNIIIILINIFNVGLDSEWSRRWWMLLIQCNKTVCFRRLLNCRRCHNDPKMEKMTTTNDFVGVWCSMQWLDYGRPPNWKIGHSQSQRSDQDQLWSGQPTNTQNNTFFRCFNTFFLKRRCRDPFHNGLLDNLWLTGLVNDIEKKQINNRNPISFQ